MTYCRLGMTFYDCHSEAATAAEESAASDMKYVFRIPISLS
jgi:hypothetical protein